MTSLHPLHRLWRLLPKSRRRDLLLRGTALLAPRPDRQPRLPGGGMIVAGEVRRASGLGQAARLMHQGLRGIGVPAWLLDVGDPVPGEKADRDDPPRRGQVAAGSLPAAAPLLLHINPPMVPWALLRLPRGLVRGRRVIGYWAWELPVPPENWRACVPFVHEIWATSRFTANALRKLVPAGCDLPVRAVPPPVAMFPPEPARMDRAAFGLPPDAVIVLVSFNLASSLERKNPLGAIAAHRRAFGERADRILVLKIGNSHHGPQDLAQLQQAVAGAPNIRIDDRLMPAADHQALIACADIVLSLHRSEGLGLVPAEAMLLGRAVVATGWSGNMEFMDEHSAALVGYRLVPARDPRGVYEVPGAVWAEPDLDDAAARLRRLADEPGARAALGARGQVTARRCLGPAPLVQAISILGLAASRRLAEESTEAACRVTS